MFRSIRSSGILRVLRPYKQSMVLEVISVLDLCQTVYLSTFVRTVTSNINPTTDVCAVTVWRRVVEVIPV